MIRRCSLRSRRRRSTPSSCNVVLCRRARTRCHPSSVSAALLQRNGVARAQRSTRLRASSPPRRAPLHKSEGGQFRRCLPTTFGLDYLTCLRYRGRMSPLRGSPMGSVALTHQLVVRGSVSLHYAQTTRTRSAALLLRGFDVLYSGLWGHARRHPLGEIIGQRPRQRRLYCPL
jgi:hypothetical protein